MTLGSTHISEILNPDRWRDFAWGHIASRALAIDPHMDPAELNAVKAEAAGLLPDHVVTTQLCAALSELGAKLHARMNVQRVRSEPLDSTVSNVLGVDYDRGRDPIPYVKSMSEQFLRIDLGESVISVERVRFQNYGATVLNLDTVAQLDNIRIADRKAGIIHIMPTTGYLQIETAAGNEPLLMASRFRAFNYDHSSRNNTLPASWLLDYTTGPVDNATGRTGFLDASLVNWIDAYAGVILFSLSGIAVGGGIASTSLSIDGISRSIGTTASAMYGLNSAFEKVLADRSKEIKWSYWRQKYSGVHVGLF